MTALGKKIIKVLKDHPNGIKASEIAQTIGCSRREVNQFLFYEQDEYEKQSDFTWIKIGDHEFHYYDNDILSKANNRQHARTFTLKQFQSLADWSYCQSHAPDGPKGTYRTKKGNRIEYDSNYELMMLEYLEQNNLVDDLGGQALYIEDSSAFRDSLSYYPDIVAYTKDHYILIIEIKPLSMMGHHRNMEKYKSLINYCEQRGYLYMMVDPASDFMTLDELNDMQVDVGLLEHFEKLVQKSSRKTVFFDDADVRNWYDDFGDSWTKKEFDLMVHSLVVFYGWYNKAKYGFNVSSEPFS